MILLLKASIGALVVVLISLLARSRNYYIAGLVPLFPTFSLIAHYTVGITRTPEELKETILFSIWAVIPFLVYLFAMYLLAGKVRLEAALLASSLLWAVAAALLVLAWNGFRLSAAASA